MATQTRLPTMDRRSFHLDRVSDPGAPGDFNFDPGKMLDGDLADGGLHAHELRDGALLDEGDLEGLRDGRGGGTIENLEEMLAAHLEKLQALHAPEDPALDPMVARYVHFTDEEERRMEALLVRTARDLHGALSYRKGGRWHQSADTVAPAQSACVHTSRRATV